MHKKQNQLPAFLSSFTQFIAPLTENTAQPLTLHASPAEYSTHINKFAKLSDKGAVKWTAFGFLQERSGIFSRPQLGSFLMSDWLILALLKI